jgi:excisionase family DNA binding protein
MEYRSQSHMSNQVMTAQEVAEYLKVTESFVTKKAKLGEIPGKKVGHLWRFQRAVIDAWLGVTSSPEKTQ